MIIDTDPGMGTLGADPEDGIAILYALASPGVTVEGITLTHGNVPVSSSLPNVTHLLDLASRSDVPVHPGATRPMRPDLRRIQDRLLQRPVAQSPISLDSALADANSAADFILDVISGVPEDLTLVAIGPLTNLANVALREPDLFKRLGAVVIMGGTVAAPGNVTPAAEFNLWMDPDAGEIVFRSGAPITMVGLDVCHQTSLDQMAVEHLRTSGSPLACHVADCSDAWIRVRSQLMSADPASRDVSDLHLYDTLAVAAAIDPTLIETRTALVQVETSTGPAQGMTVSHTNPLTRALVTGKEPNSEVAVDVDAEQFHALVDERVFSRI